MVLPNTPFITLLGAKQWPIKLVHIILAFSSRVKWAVLSAIFCLQSFNQTRKILTETKTKEDMEWYGVAWNVNQRVWHFCSIKWVALRNQKDVARSNPAPIVFVRTSSFIPRQQYINNHNYGCPQVLVFSFWRKKKRKCCWSFIDHGIMSRIFGDLIYPRKKAIPLH